MKKVKLIICFLLVAINTVFIWADCSMSDPLPCIGIPGPLHPNGSGLYAASYYWAYSPTQNVWICLGQLDDSSAKARYATVLTANSNGKTIWFGYASENPSWVAGGYHWQIPDFMKITN